MAQITPHLWFDTQAKEAAGLYTSVLGGSEITDVTTLHDTPSGDCDIVSFTLAGQPFQAISAGPLFRFNPSISFRIDCTTTDEVDALWNRLGAGGEVLMPIDTYPFSKRYGWLQDRYGLSWQVMLNEQTGSQRIVPSLMFTGDNAGKCEEAVGLYTSVFDDSAPGEFFRYGPGQQTDPPENVAHTQFTVARYNLAAMDSAYEHGFTFNEAISLMVHCGSQAEIDRYWERMSAVPEAEQCGWLKDRYGVSWQIVPSRLDEMLRSSDDATLQRVTQAFLAMKKFDLATLEDAYAGR